MKRSILAACIVAVAYVVTSCGSSNSDVITCAGRAEKHKEISNDVKLGWSVVDRVDLALDDQELWKKSHGNTCPGLAELRLHGGSATVVSMLKHESGRILQKVVIFENAYPPYELVKAEEVSAPKVIWMTGPGKIVDSNTGAEVDIKEDSIIYEKIEASSKQFYRQGSVWREAGGVE